MELPSLAQIAASALAVALGVAIGLSVHAQLQLQRRGIAGDPKTSLFNRITMAGLSMSILFAAVLVAKALSDTLSKEAFMLSTCVSAVAALVARLRSNSTVKRDARKSGARPLP
jgi:hypothetical protein